MAVIFEVPENMTGVQELLPFVADITGGVLGLLILIMLGATTWMITSAYSAKQSMISTSFVMVFAASILAILELLHFRFFWITVVIFIIATLFSLIKGGGATAA